MIITKIKIEELVFHWGAEGYGAELFRIKNNDNELFVNRYSSMDMDENDNEIWRQGEVEYKSFEDYWSEFTAQKFWLHYQPIFVHKDYKLFIREFLNNEKKSWSKDEFPQRDYWLNEIVNL